VKVTTNNSGFQDKGTIADIYICQRRLFSERKLNPEVFSQWMVGLLAIEKRNLIIKKKPNCLLRRSLILF